MCLWIKPKRKLRERSRKCEGRGVDSDRLVYKISGACKPVDQGY
jgi:hypothetical protein